MPIIYKNLNCNKEDMSQTQLQRAQMAQKEVYRNYESKNKLMTITIK